MTTGMLGEWRRLQHGLPGFIDVGVDVGFRTYQVAPVFFFPTADKSVEQRNSGKRIGCRRLNHVRLALHGSYTGYREPVSTRREFLRGVVGVAVYIHYERIAIPEIGNRLLLGCKLPHCTIDLMRHIVKRRILFFAERRWCRWLELCRAVKGERPDQLP